MLKYIVFIFIAIVFSGIAIAQSIGDVGTMNSGDGELNIKLS